VLRYASYDCLREMPKSKRFLTWASILLQGSDCRGKGRLAEA
jgi:hypothetical protein